MYQLVNVITCEIIDPVLLKFGIWALYGKGSDDLSRSPQPALKVAEGNTVYQLVNAKTCEIADTALPISVFGFFNYGFQ